MSSHQLPTFKHFITQLSERDDTIGRYVERKYSKRLSMKYWGKIRSKMMTRTKNNRMYGGGGFLPTSGGDAVVSSGD